MTHRYKISGLTCNNCVAKVKSELLKNPDVLSADVSLPGDAVITMQKHIPVMQLQASIGEHSKYIISEDKQDQKLHVLENTAVRSSWLATYKPLLIIFAFITGISFIAAATTEGGLMTGMQYFMAGFFITFSFFKMLDLKGFAESYSTYDLLAKQVNAYGYIYAFIELALGIAYLTAFEPQFTNIATIAVMGFSSIGVIKTVLNKQTIQCACLGTVFNLPMSSVTIIEDLLMVVMAAAMLII